MERIRDLLEERASEGLVGRERELSVLEDCLRPDGPVVCILHGLPGIGKSALLQAFVSRLRERGTRVVAIDGRGVEPSETGFLAHLARRLGSGAPTLAAVTRALGQLEPPVAITLDHYDHLRLLDSWLRRSLLPRLPRHTRIFLASRYPPSGRWLANPGWQDLVRPLRLEPLPGEAAHALLGELGVPADRARRIQEFARGHPLALQLAAATAREPGEPGDGDIEMSRVVEELSSYILDGIEDPRTREALVAASAVRRTTVSLLSAIFPDRDARALQDRLSSLPFVRSGPDGLVMHDSVRQAIARTARAHDPERYRRYRRSAWKRLRSEVRGAGRSELWRYTADMLYLIENPICREAFFPSGAQEMSVESADEDRGAEIVEIARSHDGPEAVDILRYWWRVRPRRFRVVMDPQGDVTGFYLLLRADEARAAPQDPLTEGWLRDREEDGIAPEEVVFVRRWLSRDDGEAPSPVQAACWLDIKRTYMEMRPDLRRVYLTVREYAPYAETAEELGFERTRHLDRVLDGRSYRCAVLDFGPTSVDGWLRALAAAELGVEDGEAGLLDHGSRELLVGERRIDLAPREFEVLSVLDERAGEAVSRRELRRTVWHDTDVKSNVVDRVIYSLRGKMGEARERLETVRGFGYRLRRD